MGDLADKTAKKQRGRPFQKGQSGNPSGRPVGRLNKRTEILRLVSDFEAETITRRVIDLALAGDMTCLRLCMDRLYPKPREAPVFLDIPEGCSLSEILSEIFQAVCLGEITPSQGLKLVEVARSTHGNDDQNDKLERLFYGIAEAVQGARQPPSESHSDNFCCHVCCHAPCCEKHKLIKFIIL